MSGLLAPGTGGTDTRERTERFDRDPGWDGHQNVAVTVPSREVRQAFGFSRAAHAGGAPGEAGGHITPAGEPAYYALRIPERSFAAPLEASGRLACTGRQFHALLGFFHAGTLNEWRTPNTVALRLQGRGDCFYAYVEYATSRWRAGGDNPVPFAVEDPATGRRQMREFPLDRPLRWSLRYDPAANGGGGAVFATVGDQTAVCHLDPGHQADGARFNRFGLLNVIKSVDDGGELWIDDVAVNGGTESFDADPGWEGRSNRRRYRTTEIRPRFDFGYRHSRRAGGAGAGELGGVVYRGDGRYPERMAYYGDRVGPFPAAAPLRASGRLALHRGVSDSGSLIGFFNARQSMRVDDDQAHGVPTPFLGVAVEGPSSEGFFLYPIYRLNGAEGHAARAPAPLRLYPDGASHTWSLEYLPPQAGRPGRLRAGLDGNQVETEVPPAALGGTEQCDRFGIVTTRVDGNGQHLFLDDLTYTARP